MLILSVSRKAKGKGKRSKRIPNTNIEDIMRLFSAVVNCDSDECFDWPYGGHRHKGIFYLNRKLNVASRYALQKKTGKNPKELMACHTCNNRKCINPNHLYWGTRRQNSIDREKDGTGLGKFTVDQIYAIRADTRSNQAIADELGVGRTTISNIKNRKSWNWLPVKQSDFTKNRYTS